jgi:hypothetical protein
MKKLIPVEIGFLGKPLSAREGALSNPEAKMGIVEKIIGPGKYIVSLENAVKVTVRSVQGLKVGNRVQVLPPGKGIKEGMAEQKADSLTKRGLHWSASFPLGFGGKNAMARLKVFVEEKTGEFWNKNSPAVYFVFTVMTENQGELQWSIYLKGRQVAIQVFSPMKGVEKDDLKELILAVEKNLRNKGFVLSASTVLLAKPFKIPEGFRLNVRG